MRIRLGNEAVAWNPHLRPRPLRGDIRRGAPGSAMRTWPSARAWLGAAEPARGVARPRAAMHYRELYALPLRADDGQAVREKSQWIADVNGAPGLMLQPGSWPAPQAAPRLCAPDATIQ